MADPVSQPARAPWHLWVVGVASLIWNSVGAMDFVMTETRNAAYMSAFTPAQREYYYGFPLWAVAAWGIAVWGGVLGSLSLLLRRRLAAHLFVSSLACIVLTDVYTFAMSGGMKVVGGAGMVAFSAVILAIAALLFAYSRSLCRSGALR